MKRESGGGRAPDSWASAHDRARVRLAERMVESLDPAESAWLEAHLVGCSSCRDLDTAYRDDRALLRAMRVVPPTRDLWARTSAALDAEQAGSRGLHRRRERRRARLSVAAFPRRGWAPIGAIGSIAAVMVVGFLLGNMLLVGQTPSHPIAQRPSATPNLVPTPLRVSQADVAWVTSNRDGSIVLRQAPVGDVCPAGAQAGCVPIDRNANDVATLSVKPKSVHQSTTSGQMVIIGQGAGPTGLSLFVVNVGKSPAPTPTPSLAPPSPATPSPPTTAGTGSHAPMTPATSSPTASIASTPQASATPKPSATASIVPNVTPAPSAASIIALASDVGVLNAETAAFSPDGAWFAFTARSLGRTSGSDIYLWHVGDGQATAATTDHRTVFAGWVGNRVIGSRADPPTAGSGAATSAAPESGGATGSAAPSSAASTSAAAPSGPAEFAATSFLIDPATLGRTSIAIPAWRPVVDPTGRFVLYWEGTVGVDPTTGGWRTATGHLVIAAWPAVVSAAPAVGGSPSAAAASPSNAPSASPSAEETTAPSATPKTKPTPGESANPGSSTGPGSSAPGTTGGPLAASPSPTATAVAVVALPAAIASAAGVDWAVAWDETGTHLAVWIEDRGDPSFGHLDLLSISGSAGQPAVGAAQLSDEPALPGFSLSDGHLAWATPSGVNAEGSQLKIYAYSGKGSGFSGPGQPGTGAVIVVQP